MFWILCVKNFQSRSKNLITGESKMRNFKSLVALLLVIQLSTFQVVAQQPAVAEARPQTLTELQAKIAELLDQPKFAAARWGVRIITQEGKVVFERDADKAFMPASNMKLYTSSAALDAFGPDYKIVTSVYLTRQSRAGTVNGDMILYGRGDPNLSPRFDSRDPGRYNDLKPADRISPIERLADQIKSRGIRIVNGNLIGDDSYFGGDLLGPGWAWGDAQFYYGAEISALTVNDNSVAFKVNPGRKVGDKPEITVQPQTRYLKIVNNAKTTATGATKIGVDRPLDSNSVEFFGTIPHDAGVFEVEIAIHDPALFAATLLKEALERRGIMVRGRIMRMDATTRMAAPFDDKKLFEIASLESQPMSEMLKVVNKQSQNLHTELLLRQLSTQHPDYGKPDEYGRPKSSTSLGADIRKQFLQKAGVEIAPLSLRDGSGLSRQDLVTPLSTTRLLQFMSSHPNFIVFNDSLGIAGIDGTLERRMRNTPAANNFRGKTGTLSFVNALSGYISTKRRQPLIVSMMGNNYTGPGRDVTSVMDQICAMLADYDGEL